MINRLSTTNIRRYSKASPLLTRQALAVRSKTPASNIPTDESFAHVFEWGSPLNFAAQDRPRVPTICMDLVISTTFFFWRKNQYKKTIEQDELCC